MTSAKLGLIFDIGCITVFAIVVAVIIIFR
jgi:hypothetical protein